ncbi:MAG: DUF6876 family protein [Waterburya sp.]
MTENQYSVLEERITINHPPQYRGTFDYYRYYNSQEERTSSMLLTKGCLYLLEKTQCHQVFDEMIGQLSTQPTLVRYQEESKVAFWTVGLNRHHSVALTCKSRAKVKILSKTLSCPDVDNCIFIPGLDIWTVAICSKDDISSNDWLALLPREY